MHGFRTYTSDQPPRLFIWCLLGAMGIRYRFTEPDVETGGREKVAATVPQHGELYNSVLPSEATDV